VITQTLLPNNFVGYVLDHQYSAASLKRGAAALKGADAHKVLHIRSIAQELGFRLYLGSLSHEVVRHGKECAEAEFYREGDVAEINTDVYDLVDLDGAPFTDHIGTFTQSMYRESPGGDFLVPDESFDKAPEEHDYIGNVSKNFPI
jgi:hypothetical protein